MWGTWYWISDLLKSRMWYKYWWIRWLPERQNSYLLLSGSDVAFVNSLRHHSNKQLNGSMHLNIRDKLRFMLPNNRGGKKRRLCVIARGIEKTFSVREKLRGTTKLRVDKGSVNADILCVSQYIRAWSLVH